MLCRLRLHHCVAGRHAPRREVEWTRKMRRKENTSWREALDDKESGTNKSQRDGLLSTHGACASQLFSEFYACRPPKLGTKNHTKKSCNGLTLAKNEFWWWVTANANGMLSPRALLWIPQWNRYRDGGKTFPMMGWMQFRPLKFISDFSSVYRIPPTSETFVSIGTVLIMITRCFSAGDVGDARGIKDR